MRTKRRETSLVGGNFEFSSRPDATTHHKWLKLLIPCSENLLLFKKKTEFLKKHTRMNILLHDAFPAPQRIPNAVAKKAVNGGNQK